MITAIQTHSGTFLGGALFMVLCVAGAMSLDRQPPFEVLSVTPAFARPGETVVIIASVRRDVARNCSATFSRFIFDSKAARFELGNANATADTIRRMERRSPGMLTVAALIPLVAAPGPAVVETAIEYQCNVMHAIWPIAVTATLPFTIL